jgi:S1-C subfamily serine protease
LNAAGPADAITSVVSVLPQWPGRPDNADEPEGSGVVVADGYTIVTAAHVLGRAITVQVRTHDGDIFDARIAGADKATDLAVLTIARKLPAARMADTEPVVGDQACAIGNAFGLGLSMTCGTVSATGRTGVGFNAVEDFLQTDAAVNPGASGGALVDGEGRLIGVLSAIFTKRSDANIGVNFAVSAPLMKKVVAGLTSQGSIAWSFAGLGLKGYPAKGATGREAAEVRHVRGGSAGEAAGVLAGDLVLRAGDRRVRKPQDLRAAIARLDPGGKIELEIIRDGTMLKLELIMK